MNITNITNITIRAVARRPLVILLPAALGLVFSVLNAYNPMIPVISGIVSITGGTFYDQLLSVIQLLLDPAFMPVVLSVLAGIALLISLFSGIVLSGYFNMIAAAVDDRAKEPGEFSGGLKRFFIKYFLVSLRAVVFMLLLAAVILVSSLPALIVSRATAAGKPELLFAAAFIDVLTVVVLLFGFLFSAAYILFWFPSAMKTEKKSFTYGKRLVDKYFWRIILHLLIFFVVFGGIHLAIAATGEPTLQLLLGWIFDTAFLTVFTVYVFAAFREYDG